MGSRMTINFSWIDASELFLDNSIKWQDIRIIFNIVFLIFIEIKEQNKKIFLSLLPNTFFSKNFSVECENF